MLRTPWVPVSFHQCRALFPQPEDRSIPMMQTWGGSVSWHRAGREWTWGVLYFPIAVLDKSLVFSDPQFSPLKS